MVLYDLKKGSETEKIDLPLSLALGCFDGLHLGHLALIDFAMSTGSAPGVFTFSKNPFGVKAIISQEEKLSFLKEIGVHYCIACDFEEIRGMDWQSFAEDILIDTLNVRTAVCGFNFRFGKNAEGNARLLSSFMKSKGRECIVADACMLDSEVVSSSRIRSLLTKGDMEQVSRLLGRNYSIVYNVSHGNGIGSTLGFPTINCEYSEDFVPLANGVYICRCMGRPAVTNFGSRPTVTDDNKRVYETYILDYDGDLYNEKVRVEFLKMLRPEIKFDSRQELIAQIGKDVAAARSYFEQLY